MILFCQERFQPIDLNCYCDNIWCSECSNLIHGEESIQCQVCRQNVCADGICSAICPICSEISECKQCSLEEPRGCSRCTKYACKNCHTEKFLDCCECGARVCAPLCIITVYETKETKYYCVDCYSK